jgi:lipoprotein-releasing system ATP-binding protein
MQDQTRIDFEGRMKEEFVIEAENICKSYSNVAILNGISLKVKRGTSVAIMGKSGSGKTTLLSILGTLEKPNQGELKLCGLQADVNPCFLRNQKIGFIYQSFHLLESDSVLENVLMPAKIARKSTNSSSPAYQRALFLLESVGLQDHLHLPAMHLSGGEKQRAAIARALINDPEIIFADEPSGNLDEANAEEVHEKLLGCIGPMKKTVVIVTHHRALASLCDESFYLEHGRLTQCVS